MASIKPPAPSAPWPGLAADRRHRGPELLGDLQLLVGPVGQEGSEQAVAVAMNAEHRGGASLASSLVPPLGFSGIEATAQRNQWHSRGHQGCGAQRPRL